MTRTHKPTITTVEELREIVPYPQMIEWLAGCGTTDLADAWDRCHRGDWMLWLDGALDLLTDRERRMIACKCVRETPIADGRRGWDLLTDERSRRAVAVAERYAAGEATDEELAAAWKAAWIAVDEARAAAMGRAWAAPWAATAAAWAAADEAGAATMVRAWVWVDDAAARAAAAKIAKKAAALTADAAAWLAEWTAPAKRTTGWAAPAPRRARAGAAQAAASAVQADIVRSIAGNPFHPA